MKKKVKSKEIDEVITPKDIVKNSSKKKIN